MHALLSFATLVLPALTVVRAQDLSVPSGWFDDDTTFKKLKRISLAQAAINDLLSFGDSDPANVGGLGWWPSGNVWSAVSLADYWAGETHFQSTVSSGLKGAWNANPNFRQTTWNDDTAWWSLASCYAYLAYKDSTYLNYAVSTWNELNAWVVTPADAAANNFPNKGTIRGTCNGQTMAGAIFWNANSGDFTTNSITASTFALLSGLLTTFTGNSTYTNAARQTVNWLNAHTYNSSDNLITDGMTISDCSTTQAEYFTYNQGMYVAAAGVLYNVTGDSSLTTRYENVVSAGVRTTHFQPSNGIINEGETDPSSENDGKFFRGIWVRGLALLYNYAGGSPQSALNILIHSYTDVQFNALIQLDSNDSSGSTTAQYADVWNGPWDSSNHHAWTQLPAADAIVSAILTNDNGEGNVPNESNTPKAAPKPPKSTAKVIPTKLKHTDSGKHKVPSETPSPKKILASKHASSSKYRRSRHGGHGGHHLRPIS